MSDPFKIEGNTAISFSGGRTSAYMLRRILDSNGGIPKNARVVFANTGRERPETLDFVQACAEAWNVEVTWLEFMAELPRWHVVTYETASRNGEPFAELIQWKQFLPNVVTRLCTQHLKVEPMLQFYRSLGWEEWTSFVGIRFDEPRRWKIRGPSSRSAQEYRELPLVDAKVTVEDVTAFWVDQSFDLGLMPWEGNCDLCFLKGRGKIERIIRDHPQLSEWWIEQEHVARGAGAKYATFRSDRPSYERMAESVRSQPMLPMYQEDATIVDCLCGEGSEDESVHAKSMSEGE